METLSYLTVHRHRDVPADELASIIWPLERPKSWNAALRSVLTRVRETLTAAGIPGDSLRSRGGFLRLALPERVDVDLECVREFCREPGDGRPAQVRADRARAAHRALSDPLLRGVAGAWTDELQAERQLLRSIALDIDAQASAEQGAFERSIRCAEAIITLDPLVERAYRHAMRGHLALGDHGKALEVAAQCRRALTEHLGADPSPETARLFAEALQADTRHDDTRHDTRHDRNVIGRNSELEAIAHALASTAAGKSHCVVVTGDAGTGKTTLIHEAMARARSGGTEVIFGRCSEDAVVPFEPFVDAIERQLDGIDSTRMREWIDRHGADVLRLLPNGFGLPGATSFGSDVSSMDRVQVMNAVRRWLTGPDGRTASTMLVVDDLQWATAASQSLLRYLFQACADTPVCFVVAVRTESLGDVDLDTTLNTATRLGRVSRVSVRDFGLQHIRELVELHASQRDPVELLATTRGHPLFATSILTEDSGDGVVDGSEYPTSVVEFVRRSEQRLGTDARLLLRLCSVSGMATSLHLLRTAAAELDDDRFADALDELVRARLISANVDDDPVQVHGRDRIDIRHPIVREVVYSVIGPGTRAALHSRIGNAIVDSPFEDAALLAFHFGRGRTAERPLAAHYACRAADSALAVGAHEDAIDHYRRALHWGTPGDSVFRCSMLIGLARSRRAVRDPDARDTAMSALSMARRLGDRVLQNDAVAASERRGMEFVQRYSPDTERVAVISAMCAELIADGRTASPEYATLSSQWVIECAWGDDHQERAHTIAHAADVARGLGDSTLLAAVDVAALIGLRVPHTADVAAAALADLNSLADADPSILHDAGVAVWLSRARLEAGDLVGARKCLDAVTDAHIDGDPELRWLVDYGRLGLALAAGELVECDRLLTRIRAVPPSPTDRGYYGRLLPALTALGTLRGDLSEIAGQSESMRSRFDTNPVLRPALAVALLDAGDRAGASELLEWYTPQRLDAITVDPMWLSTIVLIARAASDLVMTTLCEYIYRMLLDFGDCVVLTWASLYGVVHHHLASLAAALGDATCARRHIAAAREAHAQRGFAAWSLETDALALQIKASEGNVTAADVVSLRERAERMGATAVLRRLGTLPM